MSWLTNLFGGGAPNLELTTAMAKSKELKFLQGLRKESREEAKFLETEGEGISERPDITFGDELDLEDLSPEERERRSTGRIERPQTGLLL